MKMYIRVGGLRACSRLCSRLCEASIPLVARPVDLYMYAKIIL